jgi:hypothetical protein
MRPDRPQKKLLNIHWEYFPIVLAVIVLCIVSVAANVFFLGKLRILNQQYLTYAHSPSALNELLKEHLVLLTIAIKTIDTTESPSAVQALENNTTALSMWVGDHYSEKARYEFQPLWRAQIDAILAYTRAVKNKNNDEKAKQLQQISGFPTVMTDFFTQLDPHINKVALKSLFELYASRTKTIIDTSLNGDYVTLYKQQHDSVIVMNSIGETVAGESK